MPAQLATVLLSAVALTMITASLVSIARDADWWCITRGTVRGQYDRLRRSLDSDRG